MQCNLLKALEVKSLVFDAWAFMYVRPGSDAERFINRTIFELRPTQII